MRNRTYGGVRGRKTKVGRKLLRFPPTQLLIFSIQGLSLNRALRGSKKSFVNGKCVKLLETYVKHFHIYL